MQKTKIVLLTLGAAMFYGVVHDQITARLCIEYFTLAHPPLFPVSSPTLLALCWGVAATLGVGLVLGFLLAEASQSPGLPGMPVSSLYRPLLVVLGVTAAAAIMAGCIGFALSERSLLTLTELRPEAWVESLRRSQQNRFMAVWFAHCASYLFGFLGGGFLILRIWDHRQRPRLLTVLPQTKIGVVRVALALAALATIVWLRFIRAAR
jgi:hypothetical protein